MPLNDGDRETLIRAAIKSATDKNITLSIQSWGIEFSEKKERWVPKKEQRCCALGCVILECQDKLNLKSMRDWRSISIERILECDTEWVRSFQKGFDGYPRTDSDQDSYDLGFMLKDELVGKGIQLKLL